MLDDRTPATAASPEAAPLIVWLDDAAAPAGDLLGGKCAGLAEMTAAGLPVPPGFAVTTAAHKHSLDPALLHWLETPHHARRAAADGAGPGELAADEIDALHDAAEAVPLDGAVQRAIVAAYAELGRRVGRADPPVAVRSSGQSEDGADASFAGQYDTYLWVTGSDAVLAAVRRVWAGSLTGSTLSYRIQKDLGFGFSPMSVAVQLMVGARTAGVMFTLDPRTGDRSRAVIEASWGLGEAVVAGEVNPDRISVNKVTGAITIEETGSKELEHRFDPAAGGVAPRPVEPARRAALSISEAEVSELVRLGRQLEQLRGAPLDIEWAIDTDGKIFLLQVRPETVWSHRPGAAQGTPPGPRGAVECVVALFSGEAR